MKPFILIALHFISLRSVSQELSLVDYVNPLMDSNSNYSLSNRNTYPAIAWTWGMKFCLFSQKPEINSSYSFFRSANNEWNNTPRCITLNSQTTVQNINFVT